MVLKTVLPTLPDRLRLKSTVWKFQDFSVIQILREISFGKCRRAKTAVFAIFGAKNFGQWRRIAEHQT